MEFAGQWHVINKNDLKVMYSQDVYKCVYEWSKDFATAYNMHFEPVI